VTDTYFRDSLLIDMTADETTRRGAGFTRSDQIGKVFVVLSRDMRQCLICECVFTRRASAEHAKVVCSPAIPCGAEHALGAVRTSVDCRFLFCSK
jgi:hypothetical protein